MIVPPSLYIQPKDNYVCVLRRVRKRSVIHIRKKRNVIKKWKFGKPRITRIEKRREQLIRKKELVTANDPIYKKKL